ncbi:MAG: cell wall metabolism sensor histidine kinase WalK [Planctomycetes bacterium]|nr:cell wall metabolism sensor histidine kinase WalK [Planctomycetota bacterium]NUQ34266.1 PAS domain-containing protein [Planctomycetaceae bacterium]
MATENDTKKVAKQGGTTRSVGQRESRMYDIGSLRTRRISYTDLKPVEVDKLLSRIHTYHHKLAKLYEVKSLEELYEAAIAAVETLFDLKHYQVFVRNAEGHFVPVEGADIISPLLGEGESIEDLIHWTVQQRRVIFYDLEKESGGVTTIGILPVSHDQIHFSVLALALTKPVSDMSVLQVDTLSSLALDLPARAQALLQAERHSKLTSLFDNILESVPNAVIAIAGDDRVIALNANAEFLFGIKRIFAIDEVYTEVFPETLVEAFKELIARSVMGKEVADTEIEHELEGGVTVNIGVSVTFLRDRTGRPLGHLFFCRDLSLSREVQKLRELDKMKSEFVNTVSHELKTPLTAILGGLEIIEGDLETLPEDMREILGVVSDGAKRLRNLIFDLLDVSRLESGRVQVKEEPTDIREIIDQTLRVQQPHPKHTIVVDVASDVPERILMDGAKIVQCLTNYVSNAIKYSPNGGEVRVSARIDHDKRMLICGVKDQGLGISPKHQKKVWEKFYRVDASYTSEIEGTGLGLVIVQHIVELHGGAVWLESTEGKGTEFFLSLPVKTSAV